MIALLIFAVVCGIPFALVCIATIADRIWNKPPAEKMARSLLARYRYTPSRRR